MSESRTVDPNASQSSSSGRGDGSGSRTSGSQDASRKVSSARKASSSKSSSSKSSSKSSGSKSDSKSNGSTKALTRDQETEAQSIVIPEYERRLREAHSRNDMEGIESATDEYTKARRQQYRERGTDD